MEGDLSPPLTEGVHPYHNENEPLGKNQALSSEGSYTPCDEPLRQMEGGSVTGITGLWG